MVRPIEVCRDDQRGRGVGRDGHDRDTQKKRDPHFAIRLVWSCITGIKTNRGEGDVGVCSASFELGGWTDTSCDPWRVKPSRLPTHHWWFYWHSDNNQQYKTRFTGKWISHTQNPCKIVCEHTLPLKYEPSLRQGRGQGEDGTVTIHTPLREEYNAVTATAEGARPWWSGTIPFVRIVTIWLRTEVPTPPRNFIFESNCGEMRENAIVRKHAGKCGPIPLANYPFRAVDDGGLWGRRRRINIQKFSEKSGKWWNYAIFLKTKRLVKISSKYNRKKYQAPLFHIQGKICLSASIAKNIEFIL